MLNESQEVFYMNGFFNLTVWTFSSSAIKDLLNISGNLSQKELIKQLICVKEMQVQVVPNSLI